LMILINDGVVKVPHLLMSTAENGKQVPWVQPHEPPVGDIHSGKKIVSIDTCSIIKVANTRPDILPSELPKIKYPVTIPAKAGET
ncbi:hypothetical protein MJM99_32975, partial [Salmonella enterica subsp. enterica serovar Kentucky]|nr:hypothetical protein [Salmonella enterica subsp. enterica serovar Kentucky]